MSDLVARLTDDEPDLVSEIIHRMLEARPDLYARYSAAAPARTREDVRFHLQYLQGALAASDPSIFQNYYVWMQSVLLPRGITQEDIDLNFECMAEALQDSYGDEAATALEYISRAVRSDDS